MHTKPSALKYRVASPHNLVVSEMQCILITSRPHFLKRGPCKMVMHGLCGTRLTTPIWTAMKCINNKINLYFLIINKVSEKDEEAIYNEIEKERRGSSWPDRLFDSNLVFLDRKFSMASDLKALGRLNDLFRILRDILGKHPGKCHSWFLHLLTIDKWMGSSKEIFLPAFISLWLETHLYILDSGKDFEAVVLEASLISTLRSTGGTVAAV